MSHSDGAIFADTSGKFAEISVTVGGRYHVRAITAESLRAKKHGFESTQH